MERTRVIEIVEACGGYPAAWPEDERAAAEAVVAGDAGLARIIDDAKTLDRVLRDWARELVPTTMEEADKAAARALDGERYRTPRRWLPRAAMGGALAASLALGAVLLSRPDPVTPPSPAARQIALGGAPGENVEAAQDMLVWGSVFTPTPEEEMVL